MSTVDPRPVLREHPKKLHIDDVARRHSNQPEDGKPGWINMDVRWLITRETAGAEKTVFGVTLFPPGGRHEVHRHENAEEVEYLIQGEGVARIGNDDVAMGVGDAVFVPRNNYHGFRNTSEADTAILIWCYSGAASLEEAGYVTEATDQRARADAD